jgi:hypothetical protein
MNLLLETCTPQPRTDGAKPLLLRFSELLKSKDIDFTLTIINDYLEIYDVLSGYFPFPVHHSVDTDLVNKYFTKPTTQSEETKTFINHLERWKRDEITEGAFFELYPPKQETKINGQMIGCCSYVLDSESLLRQYIEKGELEENRMTKAQFIELYKHGLQTYLEYATQEKRYKEVKAKLLETSELEKYEYYDFAAIAHDFHLDYDNFTDKMVITKNTPNDVESEGTPPQKYSKYANDVHKLEQLTKDKMVTTKNAPNDVESEGTPPQKYSKYANDVRKLEQLTKGKRVVVGSLERYEYANPVHELQVIANVIYLLRFFVVLEKEAKKCISESEIEGFFKTQKYTLSFNEYTPTYIKDRVYTLIDNLEVARIDELNTLPLPVIDEGSLFDYTDAPIVKNVKVCFTEKLAMCDLFGIIDLLKKAKNNDMRQVAVLLRLITGENPNIDLSELLQILNGKSKTRIITDLAYRNAEKVIKSVQKDVRSWGKDRNPKRTTRY